MQARSFPPPLRWGPICTADRLVSPYSWRTFTHLLARLKAVARRLGAIARSIRLTRDKPSSFPSPLSLFLGQLGVAYAAWRIAALTAENEPKVGAERLLDELAIGVGRSGPLDVIGGNAGAIPALLAMSRDGARENVRELAVTLGERASPDRDVGRNKLHLEPGSGKRRRDGFGASDGNEPWRLGHRGGPARAVLRDEKGGVSGHSPRLRSPTRRHFSTRSWATGQTFGAWTSRARHPPDLVRPRLVPRRLPELRLARLRALMLDPSRGEIYENLAQAGLATTLEAIDKNLRDPDHDTSLCHGLGGLMDIALTAGMLLEDHAYRERSFSVARALIDRHARSGNWPSGLVSRGSEPVAHAGLRGSRLRFAPHAQSESGAVHPPA